MKVIFAGPSIYGADIELGDIELRPPAAQGDLLGAVLDGATVVGLIDGAFEATASVWHKEILHALAAGVTVVGGASMGALRAAECAAFGMIAVGTIARRYLNGETDDDALVAVTHGPAELGSPPLSEALVDCEATIEALWRAGAIPAADRVRLDRIARRMFYKERTVEALAHAAFPADAASFEAAYRLHHTSIKTADARAVVAAVSALPDAHTASRGDWTPASTPLWRACLRDAAGRKA